MAPRPRESSKEASERKRREAEARNARHRRTRDLRDALARTEADAAASQRELAELAERLADPATYGDPGVVRGLVDRHNAARDRADALARDRDRLASELEAAESDTAAVSTR